MVRATPVRDAVDVSIRPGAPSDSEMLADLGARTFRATYQSHSSRSDLDRYITEVYRRDRIAAALADAQLRYLIAEVDGSPVGYAVVRDDAEPPSGRADQPSALDEIYVERAFHGRGVGPALMAASLDEAAAGGADLMWLTVWEHNPRASASTSAGASRRSVTRPSSSETSSSGTS